MNKIFKVEWEETPTDNQSFTRDRHFYVVTEDKQKAIDYVADRFNIDRGQLTVRRITGMHESGTRSVESIALKQGITENNRRLKVLIPGDRLNNKMPNDIAASILERLDAGSYCSLCQGVYPEIMPSAHLNR